MSQLQLPLNPDFASVVADTLAFYRNRDEPTERDIAEAIAIATSWNAERLRLGLPAWV